MNTTQLGITAGSVIVVSVISALLFSILNKPIKQTTYGTDFRLSREYRPIYRADEKVDLKLVEDDLDFDKPGYNANRPARDPTMPDYDPFKRTKLTGGTRCVNCYSKLRCTRRK